MTISSTLISLSEEEKNKGSVALSIVLNDLGEKIDKALGEVEEYEQSIKDSNFE